VLAPFAAPGDSGLYGADISPDGKYLYTAGGLSDDTSGYVTRFDLKSGASTAMSYALTGDEYGTWDVVAGKNGKVLVTTDAYNVGPVPLRELDPATGVYTVKGAPVISGSSLERSPKHDTIVLRQLSDDAARLYDGVTGNGSSTPSMSPPTVRTTSIFVLPV
jgi:hypothetical protein